MCFLSYYLQSMSTKARAEKSFWVYLMTISHVSLIVQTLNNITTNRGYFVPCCEGKEKNPKPNKKQSC